MFQNPWMVGFIVFAVVYFSWCLQIIARKTETANDWLAWVPLVNIFYMVMVARKPLWWGLMLFVPVVNLAFLVMTWSAIALLRNKPAWAGYFMVIPVLNYMVLTRLAFHEEQGEVAVIQA